MNTTRTILLVLLAATPIACVPGEQDTGGDLPAEPVVTEELGDGVHETIVDATDEAAWVHFDFESRAHVEPATPEDDPTWDLGFLRFNIKSNGGTSGSGGGAVAILEGTSFEAVTAAPQGGWLTDTATGPGMGGSPSANTSPGYVFDNWFAYDISTHTLQPAAGRVYVVRTPEGNFFKMEMLGYYDEAGTPSFVSFRWAALP